MPVQKSTGGLMAKYGDKLNNAVVAHANDDIDYGFQRLPGGINGGIAQLVECRFGEVQQGKQNAGEYFFYAKGIVISPKSVMTPHGEVIVRGGQTSIMEMVCDTKKGDGSTVTQAEHIKSIMNEMRKLGIDTVGMQASDLEKTAADLAEAKPYFKFSTRESPATLNPDGTVKYAARVWESWHGAQGLEDYVPPEDDGTTFAEPPPAPTSAKSTTPAGKPTPTKSATPVTKNVPPAKATPTPSVKPTPKPATPTKSATPVTKSQEPPEDEISPDEIDNSDIDSLAARADGGEAVARATLTKMAEDAGVDDGAFQAAANWAEVVELIKNPTATEPEEPESAEPWKPEMGSVYDYRPLDPKTKSPSKKAVEITITAVNEAKQTFDGKSLDNPKIVYKGIPWAALQPDA